MREDDVELAEEVAVMEREIYPILEGHTVRAVLAFLIHEIYRVAKVSDAEAIKRTLEAVFKHLEEEDE
jgi:hypothetical protein